MQKAVIVIGSNSTRMAIQTDKMQTIEERIETRLMLGMTENNTLSKNAMETCVHAISQLKTIANKHAVEDITLFATSATRDAKNQGEFANLLFKETGLRLTVLSGDEEANLAFLCACNSSHCMVLDIGGGSSELIAGKNRAPYRSISANIGASRLYKKGKINSQKDATAIYQHAYSQLIKAYSDFLQPQMPSSLIAIGGTATTARDIQHKQKNAPIHECVISLLALKSQLAELSKMTEEERTEVPGLPKSRVDIYPHGLCILIATMEVLGFDVVTVSNAKNLDALLMM